MPYLPGQVPPVSRPKRIQAREPKAPPKPPSVAEQLADLDKRLKRLESQ